MGGSGRRGVETRGELETRLGCLSWRSFSFCSVWEKSGAWVTNVDNIVGAVDTSWQFCHHQLREQMGTGIPNRPPKKGCGRAHLTKYKAKFLKL